MNVFAARLKQLAGESGAKAFGIADLDWLRGENPDLLQRVAGDYARAVVLGIRLQRAALEGIVDRPTPIYFHHYRQVNYALDRLALRVADEIEDAGYRALAIPASQIIERVPMSGHVSHRLLGWAAGIGFIGRHNLLVHPEFGARMRYVSVLTDMPLRPDSPGEGSCGACRACIAACPAGAIQERREDFDAAACEAKLAEFRRLPFIGQHVCGVCVKACAGGTNG